MAILYVIFVLPPYEYKNPKDYEIIKEKISRQDKIRHFPEKLPKDTKNIQLYGFTLMPYGGEALMLILPANHDYIVQELNKYNFINKDDKIGDKQVLYNVYSMNKDFKEEDYTYYVIRDEENEKYFKKLFPFFNGIGINKDKNKILYYYMMYED